MNFVHQHHIFHGKQSIVKVYVMARCYATGHSKVYMLIEGGDLRSATCVSCTKHPHSITLLPPHYNCMRLTSQASQEET